MNRKELLSNLQLNRDEILAHANDPEGSLDKRYGPGKWSRRQVLAHLADVEMINAWRFLRALAESNSHVEDFDEQAWAQQLDYDRRPGRVSGDLFLGARNIVIYHFDSGTEEQLKGISIHAEKGPMSGWQWAQLIHDHGAHHLTQLNAARDGTPWTPPKKNEQAWKYLGTHSQS